VVVLLHHPHQSGEPRRESGALGGREQAEQLGVMIAQILTDPSSDVSPLGGQTESIDPSIAALPFAREPATRLHTGREAADGALLEPEASTQFLLRKSLSLLELAQREHLRRRYPHVTVPMGNGVGFEQATGPDDVPQKPAEYVVRERRGFPTG